jgi:hypothetical protein
MKLSTTLLATVALAASVATAQSQNSTMALQDMANMLEKALQSANLTGIAGLATAHAQALVSRDCREMHACFELQSILTPPLPSLDSRSLGAIHLQSWQQDTTYA